MKKKLLAVLLAVVLLAAMVVPAAAYTQQQGKTADALNHLGLFLGMGGADGYALDQKLTRAQGVTLLVRMIGKETEAENTTFRTPFVDVPTWAASYVGYAYNYKITNGMGPKEFGSDYQLSDFMFLTLVLRALGYSDSGETPTFTWNNPYALAYEVGLIREDKADASFTRGDAVEVFWAALNAELVGKNMTLAESLIDQGIFTAEEFEDSMDIRKNGKTEQEESKTEAKPEQDNTQTEKPEDTTTPETPDQGGNSEQETPNQGGTAPETPDQGGNDQTETPEQEIPNQGESGETETPDTPEQGDNSGNRPPEQGNTGEDQGPLA